jgi:hypothetical protein
MSLFVTFNIIMSVKTFKTDGIVCNGNIIMSVKTFLMSLFVTVTS